MSPLLSTRVTGSAARRLRGLLLLLAGLVAGAVALAACGETSTPSAARADDPVPGLETARIRSWLNAREQIGSEDATSPEAQRVLSREGWTPRTYRKFGLQLEFGMFALSLHEQRVSNLKSLIASQRGLVERAEADPDQWWNPDPDERRRLTAIEKQRLADYETELQAYVNGTTYPDEGWKNLRPVIELAGELRAAGLGAPR